MIVLKYRFFTLLSIVKNYKKNHKRPTKKFIPDPENFLVIYFLKSPGKDYDKTKIFHKCKFD